ncbi:ndufa8, NADH-ubiquinone oxidoreductase complex I 19kd subunit [Elasticomyces elasticus]|nr:ndufa8, NADH-ubiquinone oxidoreductase complex I 19kd subunit [Elasticomyces elasticus]
MAARQPRFNKQVLIDTTPLPDDIPKVPEIGASSAPLLSASFFIGARCRAYNDDYMVCKTEANGRGELECMKEGRKVSRCAASVYVCPATLDVGLWQAGRESVAYCSERKEEALPREETCRATADTMRATASTT